MRRLEVDIETRYQFITEKEDKAQHLEDFFDETKRGGKSLCQKELVL